MLAQNVRGGAGGDAPGAAAPPPPLPPPPHAPGSLVHGLPCHGAATTGGTLGTPGWGGAGRVGWLKTSSTASDSNIGEDFIPARLAAKNMFLVLSNCLVSLVAMSKFTNFPNSDCRLDDTYGIANLKDSISNFCNILPTFQ